MDHDLIQEIALKCNEYDLASLQEEIEQNKSTSVEVGEKFPGLDNVKYEDIKSFTQDKIKNQIDDFRNKTSRDPIVRSRLKNIVMKGLVEKKIILNDAVTEHLIEDLGNTLLGFGPLEPFFYDNEVTEIIANQDVVMIEKHGIVDVAEGVHFESESHIRDILEKMLNPTGRKITMQNPEVYARLFDGSRLIAQIPPLATNGTMITIRRFRKDMTIENLLSRRAISPKLKDFLQAAVVSRMNIIVSGGTGSGKTTFLNCLASFIPEKSGIITIEEPAELQLQHKNVRRLEANSQTEYTQRRLVASALRMRPDVIIVGECRQGEAFDMLQAMNTGHSGSMTTAHANSSWLLRARLVNMVQMAGMDLPHEAIVELIAGATDMFIHITRDKSGRRRLDHICEVIGVKRNDEGILNVDLNPLWQYNPKTDTFDYIANKFERKEKLIEQGGWRP